MPLRPDIRGVRFSESPEAQYEYVSDEGRSSAIDELESLELPVGPPDELKRQSVPDPEDLLP